MLILIMFPWTATTKEPFVGGPPMLEVPNGSSTSSANRFEKVTNEEAFSPQTPVLLTIARSNTMLASVILCEILGCISIFLNLFVVVALLRNKKRVLSNVFYVLVLHCAIVDLIRGACLVVWSSPHLLTGYMHEDLSSNYFVSSQRLLLFKINQYTLVILRSCNLLTICNLLIFTLNEFIVIRHPLYYRQHFRRRTVMIILSICWLFGLLFGAGSAFSGFFQSLLSNNNRSSSVAKHLSVEEEIQGEGNLQSVGISAKSFNFSMMKRESSGSRGISTNVLSMLIIFVLCYICLFTVLICYGTILKTIRDFQNTSKKFHSEEGQRSHTGSNISHISNNSSNTNNNKSTSSIYHKRSADRFKRSAGGFQLLQPTRQSFSTVSTRSHLTVGKVPPDVEQEFLRLSTSTSCSSNNLHANSQASGNNIDYNVVSNNNNNNFNERKEICLRHINAQRKWHNHLMSRHKYLIVIGSVFFVDILFLFPYSGIQMMAFLHLNNFMSASSLSSALRWGLQILIGIHSVFQPLCYFRMKEFRRLACCCMFSYSKSRQRTLICTNTICNTGITSGNGQLSTKLSGGSRTSDNVLISPSRSVLETIEKTTATAEELKQYARKRAFTATEASYRTRTSSLKKRASKSTDKNNNNGEWIIFAKGSRWSRRLSLLCTEEGEELELELERFSGISEPRIDSLCKEEMRLRTLSEGNYKQEGGKIRAKYSTTMLDHPFAQSSIETKEIFELESDPLIKSDQKNRLCVERQNAAVEPSRRLSFLLTLQERPLHYRKHSPKKPSRKLSCGTTTIEENKKLSLLREPNRFGRFFTKGSKFGSKSTENLDCQRPIREENEDEIEQDEVFTSDKANQNNFD